MLQGATIDLCNPLVPKTHNSDLSFHLQTKPVEIS